MTETKVYCDICKNEIDKKQIKARENKRIKISIFDNFKNGRVFENTYDICDECLDKVHNQFGILSGDYKV